MKRWLRNKYKKLKAILHFSIVYLYVAVIFFVVFKYGELLL